MFLGCGFTGQEKVISFTRQQSKTHCEKKKTQEVYFNINVIIV